MRIPVAWTVSVVRTALAWAAFGTAAAAEDFPKPYDRHCTERENVFEFTQKPVVKLVAKDRYEITFTVKGNCDVTVGVIDEKGVVVRHLASGVLGKNAPAPFEKDSLSQKIYWNGKDDLEAYHKSPEKLGVRVMLGLKPGFERRLGGTSPKNLTGAVMAMAVGPDGGLVFGGDFGRLRMFDHDGRYVKTLTPPPAKAPVEMLTGLGYAEYEPGRRSVQGPNAYLTMADRGIFLPEFCGGNIEETQPALAGNRLIWIGMGLRAAAERPAKAYYIGSDGAFDQRGMTGLPFSVSTQKRSWLASSPDGRWIYGILGYDYQGGENSAIPAVFRWATAGNGLADVFAGDPKAGGREKPLHSPMGLDCDAQGRLYVADQLESRVQVFSPEGAVVRTIKVDRPHLVRVHQKTGGVYVAHVARARGKSVDRITRFTSFEKPEEEYHVDGIGGSQMALDSWSERPRIWLAGIPASVTRTGYIPPSGSGQFGGRPGAQSVRIYEETGGGLKKIADFEEDARREAGENWIGWFPGGKDGSMAKVECDPVREEVYYRKRYRFDLRSGRYLGWFATKGGSFDDTAFDKRGYMHIHWNPGFGFQGVTRVDPGQGEKREDRHEGPFTFYPEVPYDYGVEEKKGDWAGKIPTKDQPGPMFFQDGVGVNMRGDVAEICNIFYVPKMEKEGFGLALEGLLDPNNMDRPGRSVQFGHSYGGIMRDIEERLKKNEEIYSIRRQPGISLAGPTIWTFDSHGELLQECAVIGQRRMAGVRMDEDRKLYFVNTGTRVAEGKAFLEGRGGTYGYPEDAGNRDPFTGTLIKTKGGICRFLSEKAAIPMDTLPSRPADVVHNKTRYWVEGAEWLYAGASPIVSGGCVCPTQRLCLDWYKRSFVPESYRHSIGVVDTAGNLVMHIGRFGNWDDAQGMKPGDTDVPIFNPRFVGGTDNYLVFQDWGERLVVLRLDCQAEETAALGR